RTEIDELRGFHPGEVFCGRLKKRLRELQGDVVSVPLGALGDLYRAEEALLEAWSRGLDSFRQVHPADAAESAPEAQGGHQARTANGDPGDGGSSAGPQKEKAVQEERSPEEESRRQGRQPQSE